MDSMEPLRKPQAEVRSSNQEPEADPLGQPRSNSYKSYNKNGRDTVLRTGVHDRTAPLPAGAIVPALSRSPAKLRRAEAEGNRVDKAAGFTNEPCG
jgi:hypothetical protein